MRASDRELTTPVRVEVIAYAPTAFFHCQHCELTFQHVGVGQKIHDEQTVQALPPDLSQDYQALSEWVRALTEHYCGQVIVKVIDAASVEGFWKSLRYGVRRYPAVIVAGQDRCLGTDNATVQALIDRRLSAPVSA